MKPIALDSATLSSFGVNPDVLAYYGYQDEAIATTLTFELTDDTPIDITNYTFTFSLQKQLYDRAADTKQGYQIKGMTPDPDETDIDLSDQVSVLDGPAGKAQLYFPASLTAIGPNTDGTPTIYAGFLEFQDNASVGELIQQTAVVVIIGKKPGE